MKTIKNSLLFLILLQLLFCSSGKHSYVDTKQDQEGSWDLKNIKTTANYIKTSLVKYFKDNNIYKEDININCQRLLNRTTNHINTLTFTTALDYEFQNTYLRCNYEYYRYILITIIKESIQFDREHNKEYVTFIVTIKLINKKKQILWNGRKEFNESRSLKIL